eukprot:GDKI01008427.1.p1 GENE.GDKI01008427.1~~GDKI01008427.1.p1  ORF type:complete len:107 (-),score=13.34 GDKI01008427.1:106-426(-)
MTTLNNPHDIVVDSGLTFCSACGTMDFSRGCPAEPEATATTVFAVGAGTANVGPSTSNTTNTQAFGAQAQRDNMVSRPVVEVGAPKTTLLEKQTTTTAIRRRMHAS